jgi:hypothetical protein
LFDNIIQCLSSKEGGEFRSYNETELEDIADRIASRKVWQGRDPYSVENKNKKKAEIFETLKRYPHCTRLGRRSTMTEAFADWMGAEVVGQLLGDQAKRGKKLETDLERIAPIATEAAHYCASQFGEPSRGFKTMFGADMELACEDAQCRDEHPELRKRADMIFLRNQTIREKLGCKPDPNECKHSPKKEEKGS